MKNKDLSHLISEANKYVESDCQQIIGNYVENELKKANPSHNISGFDAWNRYIGTDNWEKGYIIEKTEIKPFKIGKFKLWNDYIDTRIVKVRLNSNNSMVKSPKGSIKEFLFTIYDKSYEHDLVDIIKSVTELSGISALYSYHYNIHD
jgi:hypothetical protein